MKQLLLISSLALTCVAAFVWQRRHAEAVREQNAGLRMQLEQREQLALQMEQQNEATRKMLEQQQTALLDLQTRWAAATKHPAASAPRSSNTLENRWRDDVPFIRLSKEHLSSLSVGIIARDPDDRSHLTASAATLLGVGTEELATVNEAIRNLCEQYLALELDRAPLNPKYQRSTEGMEAVFAIPALQKEGADLKAAFIEALNNAIGKTRTDLILNYGRDAFWRQLAGFGENAKTIDMLTRVDEQGREYLQADVHFEGPQNGGYRLRIPPNHEDPNAPLCRALWERRAPKNP